MDKLNKTKNSFFKKFDFWLACFIMVFGFYSGFFKNLFNHRFQNNPGEAKIEIDYGQSKRAFQGELADGMSVLEALLAAGRGGNFGIRYALLDDSTDIMDIGGLVEDGLDGYWRFYLNGEEIKTSGIHKIKLKSGDEILAQFK